MQCLSQSKLIWVFESIRVRLWYCSVRFEDKKLLDTTLASKFKINGGEWQCGKPNGLQNKKHTLIK